MLSVSVPAKAKSAQPESTHVEVVSTPLPWWALLVALIVAAVFAVAMAQFSIGAKPSRAEWKHLTGQRLDDHGYALGHIFSGRAHQADIVILGTSAAREALPVDSELAATLLKDNRALHGVANLATSSQSLTDTLYLADATAPRRGQLFVVFLSFSSLRRQNPFDTLEQGYYLHAPQVLIKKYAGRAVFPDHWNNPLNQLLYQARAVRHLWGRQLEYRLNHWVAKWAYGRSMSPYQQHRHAAKTSPSKEKKATLFNQLDRDFKLNYAANLSYVVPTIKALAAGLNNSGARLVVAAPPEFNRELRNRFPGEYRQFAARLQTLQTEFGFELLNLNTQITWLETDFVDLVHVSRTGREKWTRALGIWLDSVSQASGQRQ